MTKTVRKIFWAWDFEKEEKWLHDMSKDGFVLTKVSLCKYTFEKCEPSEYQVCVQLLKNPIIHEESQQYIQFVEETGAEYIGAVMNWVYFRKKTETGEFQLLSDNGSRIKQLNRILSLLYVLLLMNLPFGILCIYHALTQKALFLSSSYLFLFNLALSILLIYGAVKIYAKKQKLIQDQTIFE